MDNLKKNLEERKKSELIALIIQMLHEEPGLQRLLTSPLSTISSQKSAPDTEKYRQQVQDALSAGDYRRHYKRGEVQQRLSAIKDTADQYATLENYAEALTIYEVLVNEIIQHFNDYREEYIAFTVTLVGCVDGLDSCFAGEENNPQMRLRVIRALFAIYRFYTDSSMDFDEDIPGLLIGNTNPEERQTIAGWLRDALSHAAEEGYTKDILQSYRTFLSALERASRS